MVSKDWRKTFISDVISLGASGGGCVGVVFNTGLGILGSVGLGELCVLVLEEENILSTVVLKRMVLQEGKAVSSGLEDDMFPLVCFGCECIGEESWGLVESLKIEASWIWFVFDCMLYVFD